jgi:intein-encoded DNA endonuclease-like protein
MGGLRWTRDELDFLRSYYGIIHASDVAAKLGRTENAIIRMSSKIKVKGFRKRVRHYPPSPELAYIIGVVKGDGYIYVNKHKSGNGYAIGLRAKDFEFVSEFRDNVVRLLGRYLKIYRVKNFGYGKDPGSIFVIHFCDKSLFMVLKKPIAKLEKYIMAYPERFLRGFFDAEGFARTRREGTRRTVRFEVGLSNTDIRLLDFVRKLLVKLKIYPAPRTYRKPPHLGKLPCYEIKIYRKDSVRRFMSLIGSSIPRKRLVV